MARGHVAEYEEVQNGHRPTIGGIVGALIGAGLAYYYAKTTGIVPKADGSTPTVIVDGEPEADLIGSGFLVAIGGAFGYLVGGLFGKRKPRKVRLLHKD